MVNGKTPLYLTLLALAALGAVVLYLQPYSADWPGTGYTRPAQRYLQAAIRQDSVALTRLSLSPKPVVWALTAARTQPVVLDAWAAHVQAWVGRRRADTAEIFVYNASSKVCGQTPIVLRFVGSGDDAHVLEASSTCLDRR
jgi:hypothetical protein